MSDFRFEPVERIELGQAEGDVAIKGWDEPAIELTVDGGEDQCAVEAQEQTLVLSSCSASLALHVPELVYAVRHPQISGPDGVVLTLDFRAFYENDADATILKSTLINSTADY